MGNLGQEAGTKFCEERGGTDATTDSQDKHEYQWHSRGHKKVYTCNNVIYCTPATCYPDTLSSHIPLEGIRSIPIQHKVVILRSNPSIIHLPHKISEQIL